MKHMMANCNCYLDPFSVCLINFTGVYVFIAYLNKNMGINEHSDLTNFSEYISNENSSGAPVNYGVTRSFPSCFSDQPRLLYANPVKEVSTLISMD